MKKENLHTPEELKELQSLPLDLKIRLTKQRIREWIRFCGEDGVYISFSGGKDSTVLLDIVRQDYPDIPAVFFDTGLEFPEIRDFVKQYQNVTWIKPEMNFKQVIEQYGYPVVSKDVSQVVYEIRKYGKDKSKRAYSRFQPDSEYNKKYKNHYSLVKWSFLLDDGAPAISHMCCKKMKKEPAKQYEKQSGRFPITAEMAIESRMRKTQWMKHGCNTFEGLKKVSKPMSFWTEQDVLQYIKENNLPIASVYGDVVEDKNGHLTTTGMKRTGCVFCAFGAHLEKSPNRFELLKETHPNLYNYCMKSKDEGGLGMDEVLNYMNIRH